MQTTWKKKSCRKAYVAPPKGVLLPAVVVEADFAFEGDVGLAFVVKLVSTGHEGGHRWGWWSGVVRHARWPGVLVAAAATVPGLAHSWGWEIVYLLGEGT